MKRWGDHDEATLLVKPMVAECYAASWNAVPAGRHVGSRVCFPSELSPSGTACGCKTR